MPPEPLPWDRKDFFKERKHERSETTSSSFGGGSTPRWKELSYSSSNHYGSSRDFNRWGPHDFRRPPGHGKQGSWHMLAEESDHMYAPYRSSDKMLEDENCRPFLRGDGRYVRNSRGYFSQREWRGGHSWEMSNGSSNMLVRQHDVSNDHRSVDEMLMFPPSHPAHSDFANTWDQHQLKDQHDNNKMGGVNGLGTGQRGDRENSLDWKPLKWTRSGSLSSRGSGFSHSSSSKSLGVADSNEGKAELQLKNATPVLSLSGDAAACVTSAAPSEDISSRKKARLGWGEGLAKYEKKKVEGPDTSENKDEVVVSASNVEPIHSQTSNLSEKSHGVMGFSDCASPATPSSVACSSSPGIEEKTLVKSTDAYNAVSNSCGSPGVGSQCQMEGLSFNLEKMEVSLVANLGSSLADLLQYYDPSSMDSSFVRSTAMNKLLAWKGDISKSLELTESEIESLENELKSMRFESGNRCPSPAASSPRPFESDAKPCNVQGVASNCVPPSPLLVASCGDDIVEKVSFCNGELEEVHADVKDDFDSPVTATSKLAESVSLTRADSSTVTVKDDFYAIQSARMNLEGAVPCADEEENGIFTCKEDLPSVDVMSDKSGEYNLCNLILASNKESASRASEVFNKLLPSEQCRFDFSGVTNGSSWQSDALVVEKIARRKQLLRFKERAVTLKFKVYHHLWKEDMLRKYRVKSQKKWEQSLRTTQSGFQKHRSSIRARFSSPAGNLSLDPATEILNFTSKLLSDSQVKLYRNALKMPALILDKKEKIVSRFISSNGLVEDPWAIEKEKSIINPWTSDEKEIFMHKLATFGKDFQKIASFLDHKSTADCVEFYYKNHKSDCFEKIKKSKQTKSSTNYLVASSTKWNRELNAASLDILGAASLIAAGADHAVNSQRLCSSRIFSSGYCNSKITEGHDGVLEDSSILDVLGSERETVAADVLAGICGSMSSEVMSSCTTTSVNLVEGYRERKCQKVDSVAKPPLTFDVTQNYDEETCSDESYEEMDPADWTDEEKSIFIQAVSSYGKDFAMISHVVRTRTRDQCKVFFSKARKCLGLDLMHPGPRNFGTPVSNIGNEGGSDTEDACAIGTGSAISSDKLDSKIDEDLMLSVVNTEHNESDAEERIRLHADLEGTEDKNASGILDQNDPKIVDKMVSDPAFVADTIVMNSVNQLESVQAQKVLIVSTNAESERDQAAGKSVFVAEAGPVGGAVDASTSNAITAAELKAVAEVSNDGMENGFPGQELLLPEKSLCIPSGLTQDSTSLPLQLSSNKIRNNYLQKSSHRLFTSHCPSLTSIAHKSRSPRRPLCSTFTTMAFSLCSTKTLLLFFLISAIPVAFIISSELAKPPTHVYHYHSSGFFRECAKWDDLNRRFLVSFIEGGIGEIAVPEDHGSSSEEAVLKEVTVVKDPALAGNSSLGIVVDRPRNRLLVAISDVLGNKYNALAAYDLSTWDRLFLTTLGGPDNEKAFADDVAVDAEGNAYVTDAKSNKIWKVGADGKFVSFIRNPLFIAKEWYKNLIGLNGIVYHPDGFLIVIHTFSGMLYKIDVTKEDHEVKLIKVAGGSLAFGDGLELLSPTKLVVAGNPSGRLLESLDGWETASVVAKFKGPGHRLATAATVKDGRVYLNHLLGMGYPKKQHALVEAVFSI